MRIALVSPYDLAHPGGVSDHIRHVRAEFERLGHDVVTLAPRARKGGIEIRDGFYGIGRTVSIPGNGSTVRVTFDVTLYTAVKAIMRRERFDIVHVHEPLMPVLPYLVLLNSPAVNVATFHAYRASNPWYTAFKPYMTFVLSRLDGRIAVSDPAREFVSQYFDGPYELIPNGIDTRRFAHVEPFPWATDGVPRVLFVGRYNEPRKGLKYLLRAMPLVRQQFPDARLVVVGAGRPDKFDGLIERYGVRGVDFVGFVPFDELPRYYASCDVFCAPSIGRESFGIVLLEAMAAGRPVVAGNIPGYASVLSHGREGLLVPPKDPQALALALVRVLADRIVRREFAAAGVVTAEQYAWPQIARRVLDAYGRAARGAAVAPRQRGFA
ncbi:MAG TPA: glycosyltransferase family 4 protein [Thermomicrobiales bacterium]|nr:glycosyltransferase family 4 protein [Thermomicrobiales bacterium]